MSSLLGRLLVMLVSISLWALCGAQEHVKPNMRSFSNAIKSGILEPGVELTLYECNTGEPGVITEQWFTGEVMDADANIRIYVDGEILPSIDFQLYLGHGIGFGDKGAAAPWNTKRISLDAYHGIYNTYQIPFSKSVKITATHPDGGMFWYIVRGVYNYPLVFGVLELPSTARLRLYKKVHMTLEPFEFVDMVHVQGTAGAVFQVTLAANSSTFRYLEGCVRAYVDDSDKPLWLSSGTEDFFLSAYYFNEGIFHSDNSGLTYLQRPGAMSAYKFFETDPLLFSKSFRLMWRSGELVGSGMDDCPNDFRKPKGNIDASTELKTTVATTYAWVYEW